MKSQKGVSLIITFLIMTILLAVTLSISTILFNEIKILSNIGNSVSSIYAAESGAEKTLYFDRKQIPVGSNRGICNICNACSSTDCTNCTATPLAFGGCDITNCNNCKVKYDSIFDDKNYTVEAKVIPNSANPIFSDLIIDVKGFYRDVIRTIELNYTK